MKKSYFGTDGIRGRVGEYPITADFMLKLGWAAGRVFSLDRHPSNVLIGKDTRISGYMFESALEAGLSAAGINTQLLGPMPTPAIAYLTRTFRAQAGIVISASHNPHYDNGIKFFGPDGMKLPDEVECQIEEYIDKPMTTVDSSQIGKAARIGDAVGRYIEFCKSTIPSRMEFNGVKIVVDCAHGSTYHIAPHVFEEVGASVAAIGVQPNGLNINEGVGATKPERLAQAVLEEGADFGIALDGDGDRLIMVDHKGEIVDGDELVYIIAKSRLESGGLRGPVIGTLMSNLGLEHALEALGVEFKRAAVGDRYVMEMMLQHDSVLGGESSGHIICRDRITTGDGIVSALQVMAAMHETGKSLNELKSGMTKYPQCLVNVKVRERVNLDELEDVQALKSEIQRELGNKGRVLLRASGTEPLIRVMVEGQDADIVRAAADRLANAVSSALN
ncbi:phosphoglucosamine mutase [Methylocaldum szegediense]|uniref:Phosphoglucosamine mutase n=1 Tax=Methylocaldum szegediense TaxID=73780 RepID=A0ABM9HW78_9GAMM|nr:phosphoglucosamine mutase [Methylocaldum szegediense]CAI8727805.1 phosphoglucosamine mutase [Methylocaldum szegediense]